MIWSTRFQAQRYIRLCFTPALAARHRAVPATIDGKPVGWTVVLDAREVAA